jgi:hypothetical protein
MTAILIFAAIGFLILAYILAPFMKPEQAWLGTSSEEDESIASLKVKKDSFLRAIKDIDFEYASKKINDADYRGLKNHYSLKAADIIEKLEKMQDVNTDKNREE